MTSESLKEVLECCICTETLTDPRSLPCGHTLCLQCVKGDSDVRTKDGRYPCPVCLQTLDVPAAGIHQIGCNVMVKNLLELLDKRQTNYPCAYCPNEQPSSACITCNGERLCESCGVIHLQHNANHNIVDLDEFRQGRHDEAFRTLQSPSCQQHNNDKYEYYCRECKHPLCKSCIILGRCQHQDSRCSINEASEDAKGTLLSIEEVLDTRMRDLRKKMEEFERNDESSKSSHMKAREDIERYYDNVIENIQKHEDATLQEAIGLYEGKQATGYIFKEKLGKTLKSCVALKDESHRLRQYGSQIETLMLDQNILKEHASIRSKTEVIGDVPKSFVPRIVPTYQIQVDSDIMNEPVWVVRELREIDTRIDGDTNVSSISDLDVLPNGDILAVDSQNSKVKRFNNLGDIEGVIKSENLENPWNCVSLSDGTVKVSGYVRCNIVTFTEDGRYVRSFHIGKPTAGLAVTSKQEIVVTINNKSTPCVALFSATGKKLFEKKKDNEGNNLFGEPIHAAVNSNDDIIVTDRLLNTVFVLQVKALKLINKYNAKGEQQKLNTPQGVCVDKDDYIYVADTLNNRIIMLTPGGVFHRVVLGKDDGLDHPAAITFDNERHLLVSCRGEKGTAHLIKVFEISK